MRITNITGEKVVLRAVEPEDLDVMYVWENDPQLWEYGQTRVPYSRYQLRQFIERQGQDLGDDGELRLIICLPCESEFRGQTLIDAGEAVGVIDIFEYSPTHRRAGVGVLIDPAYRGCGYASEALNVVENYLKYTFELHQLWCNVACDNFASMSLFEGAGYSVVGVKRGWIRRNGDYLDEALLQKIL